MTEAGDSRGIDMVRWYAVRTQPAQEKRAECQLQQQGYVTFLPLLKKSVRHARKLRQVRAALFPGYLFVQLDLDRDRWRSVNSTYGVSGLIMGADQPMPVPVGVVESFIDLTQADGLVDFTPELKPGVQVVLVSGGLSGTVGRLKRCDARGRVEVLLQIMGQEVCVKSGTRSLMPA